MNKGGFSLVQIMIAAGVIAILGFGGYFLFTGNNDGDSYIEEKLDAVEEAMDVKEMLESKAEVTQGELLGAPKEPEDTVENETTDLPDLSSIIELDNVTEIISLDSTGVLRTLPKGLIFPRVSSESEFVIFDTDTLIIRSRLRLSEILDLDSYSLPIGLFIDSEEKYYYFGESSYEGNLENPRLHVLSLDGSGISELVEDVNIYKYGYVRGTGESINYVAYTDSTPAAYEQCWAYGDISHTRNVIKILNLTDQTVTTLLEGDSATEFSLVTDQAFENEVAYFERDVFIMEKGTQTISEREKSNADIANTLSKDEICFNDFTYDGGYSSVRKIDNEIKKTIIFDP